MSLPENRRILLELDANHPDLLNGLELWVQLGLLSDRQILKLSQQYLTSVLPGVPVRSEPVDFITTSEAILETPVQRPNRQPLLEQLMQFAPRSFVGALQQELSVIWLLMLGVFLVVISSAVLAASQWQNVSPIGQYLVLLGYTLSFWGVSFWAGRQANLRLTASTLQTLTLLLVPVNFWAIDRFLLQSPQSSSILTALIAAIMLSGVTIAAFRQRFPNTALLSLDSIGYLGLSYLQCGWSFSNFPIVAVYLGAIAVLVTVRPTTVLTRLVFPTVAIALLFLRAIFVREVDVAQLGLAFGIVGWIIARVAQNRTVGSLWALSGGLLGFGWLVSVSDIAWQALIVSGLALLYWKQLLQRYWRRLDIVGLLIVGLQSLWLVWRLVPNSLQNQVINFADSLTQSIPLALLGVVLLPYLIGILAIANWVDHQQHPELAKFTEAIALVFGTGLTIISLFAPAARTLNLVASTLILGRLTQQKQHLIALVYATHLAGLGALIAAIDWRFPSLDQSTWASIFLGIAIAQWSFSLPRNRTGTWYQSAWHLGFGVATLSYVLFFYSSFKWAIVWLLIPTLLTGIAVRDSSKRTVASWASAIALILLQLLTVQHRETGLLSLGFAVVLMLVNTRCLQRIELAALTFGFSLIAASWWIWHWIPSFTVESWLLVGAIAVALLWQFQRWGQQHRSSFIALYAQAADNWAIVLSALVLISLAVHTICVYERIVLPSGIAVVASGLIAGSLVYRTWRNFSIAAAIGVGIGLELLIAESLAGFELSLAALSVANVGLGGLIQLIGEVRQRRTPTERLSLGWHGLPLAYGIFALMLRSQLFTAWTGWVSLGVAGIAIAVGRRQPEFKPLTYVGMIGSSIAVSELALYQVRMLPLSDQLMTIAPLGTILMLLYRYPHPAPLNFFRLNAEEIRPLAHLHWAISSGVLAIAAILTLIDPASSGILVLVGFTTGMVLSLYAIWQARHRPPQLATEAWLYAGLLETAGLIWYLSTKPWFSGFFNGVVRPYAGAISAIAAFLLFVLPWNRFGWARQPWQRIALAIPLLVLAATSAIVHPVSLIVVAVFYSLVASIRRQVRWTYLSAGLLDWLMFDQLHQLNVDVLFWQVLPIGLSILYFAQVEPSFVQLSERLSRHYVRICGIGLICGTALFTQENYGILPGVVSLIAIFAGLGLRIRAFLYVGTLVFLLNVANQLIVFVALYSLLKWIIGLCLGILLIWVAANFETRRDQVTALMQNWLTELQEWQ